MTSPAWWQLRRIVEKPGRFAAMRPTVDGRHRPDRHRPPPDGCRRQTAGELLEFLGVHVAQQPQRHDHGLADHRLFVMGGSSTCTSRLDELLIDESQVARADCWTVRCRLVRACPVHGATQQPEPPEGAT